MFSIWTLALFMLFNGVFFLPPSEYVYFDAYFGLGGSIGYPYAILPLANSAGHFILYELSRGYSQRLANLESKVPTNYFASALRYVLQTSRRYFRNQDKHAWAIFYGRCVPVVHTGISIIAGIAGVSRLRFLVLTAVGNVVFSLECWIIIRILSSIDDYFYSITSVALCFAVIYVVHICIVRRLNNRRSP